ncbi:hypothetical protein P7K49_015234 [Saguinus oedipus]|uniref:Uncharacterized protein n=1 Tax=Saguinus oedipus TaxID=9490 RepID=A0ABQ9V9H4_SAGOE|nr:hypothetical protein P7K49_015234 [Saguinus oedipus]
MATPGFHECVGLVPRTLHGFLGLPKTLWLWCPALDTSRKEDHVSPEGHPRQAQGGCAASQGAQPSPTGWLSLSQLLGATTSPLHPWGNSTLTDGHRGISGFCSQVPPLCQGPGHAPPCDYPGQCEASYALPTLMWTGRTLRVQECPEF